MQLEIVEPGELLDVDGRLRVRGWARRPILRYERGRVRAPWCRIKEWDYYCVLCSRYGFALTCADLGYLGLVSAVWLDFEEGGFHQESRMVLLPRGRMGLPESSGEGDVVYEDGRVSLRFLKRGVERRLIVEWPGFMNGGGLSVNVGLSEDPGADSMVIVVPFKNPRQFYYNRKVNCMPAEGVVVVNGEVKQFGGRDCFGVLDWGRGVWPYKCEWYWGSLSTRLEDGRVFGFNIGYGFGDTSAATENIVFVDGRGHKLDQVTFHFDRKDYLKPWTFTSNDGRFEMTMEPILDRCSKTNLLVLKSVQHQVFGKFTGRVILDDGSEVRVRDAVGFAEYVVNRW
ncbi:MAG: DUF2804 domain-containing protein [Candidatus Jordarchaeales archaeon]